MGRSKDSRRFVTSRQSVWFLALILLLALALRSAAQEPAVIGQWPGYPQTVGAIAVGTGNHAYMANGALETIDLSNPADPRVVAAYVPEFSGWVGGRLFLAGNRLFAGSGTTGVFDISNPTKPIPIPNTPVLGAPLALTDGYLYTGGGYVLEIFDVSAPDIPTLLGELEMRPGLVEGGHWRSGRVASVAVSGKHAYVAWEDRGLVVVDVSDPECPSIVGAYAEEHVEHVVLYEQYALISVNGGWLSILDIADPSKPKKVMFAHDPIEAHFFAISGHHAFLGSFQGVQVYSILDPTNPELIGSYVSTNYTQYYLPVVLGSRMLVANEAGVDVFDIKDIAHPMKVGEIDLRGSPGPLAVSGDYVFTACGFGGLQTIDMSDPSQPTRVARTMGSSGSMVESVTVSGHYAYANGSGLGLKVLDVSKPERAVIVGESISAGWGPVTVVEPYAYMPVWHGVGVWDVSKPESPTLVCTNILVNGTNYIGGVPTVFSGHYAFTPVNACDLAVLDTSDPTNWVSVARAPGSCHPAGARLAAASLAGLGNRSIDSSTIAIAGNYVFTMFGILQVFDVRDPLNPSLVGTYDPGEWALTLAVSGHHLFITQQGNEPKVHILDISDPTNPTPVTTFATPGNPEHIVISGNRAIVTDSRVGLVIVDCSSILSQVPTMLPPRLQDGAVQLRFEGETGIPHRILRAANVTGPWIDVSQAVPVHGRGSLADPASLQTSMFYRVVRD